MPASLFLPRLPDSPEPEVVSAADAPGTSSAAAATAAPAEKRDSPDSSGGSGGSGGSTPPLRFNIADVSLPDLCQKSLEEVAEEIVSVQAQFVWIKNKCERRSRADAERLYYELEHFEHEKTRRKPPCGRIEILTRAIAHKK